MNEKKINTPLSSGQLGNLQLGDRLTISGTIYTLGYHTHKYLINDFKKKKRLPFDMKDQIIYYTEPLLLPGAKFSGSYGPVATIRMEPWLSFLLSKGIKAVMGKGPLSKEAISLLKKNSAVYLITTGGAGAFLSKFIKNVEVIEYKDLGPSAIYKLEVENFPCIVALAKGKYILKS